MPCMNYCKKIKKLEIDEAYANETLNKNLLKRLEIVLKLQISQNNSLVQLNIFLWVN
jgi:hypothetical protein